MFRLTLSNLILIQFLLWPTINSIQQAEGQYSLVTTEYSDSIQLRLWYILAGDRVISIKYWEDTDVNSSGGQEIKMKKKDSYRITNLKACTTYTIRANIKTKQNQIITKTITKTTNSANPLSEISSLIPISDSVNVSFKYENYNCINSMKILLNNVEFALFEKPNLPVGYMINQLAPCTLYEISLQTNSFINSDIKQFKTDSVKEYPIEDLKFDIGKGLLTWKRSNFGRQCVKGYDINIENELGGNRSSSDFESHDLSGLPGCSNFTINITPRGINGQTLGNTKWIGIQTGFKEPSSIVNLQGVNSSSNSITIAWHSPTINPSCVKYYTIEFNGQKFTISNTSYVVDHLEPCKEYNITVCIVTTTDRVGSCSDIILSTTVGVPGKVEDLQKSVNNSMHYIWRSPSYGGGCVQRFKIDVNETTGAPMYTVYVDNNEFHVDTIKLKSCQNYFLSVIPVTSNNLQGPSERITIRIQPTKPSPPTVPLLISKTATSLELKSEYYAANDYCPLLEAVFKCQEIDSNIVYWANMTLSDNKKEFTGSFNDLKDSTNYKCTAYVKNDNDDLSDASQPWEFKTDEKLSEPPEIIIDSIQFDSFTFSWMNLDSRVNVKRYHVIFSTLGEQYQRPDGCIVTVNQTFFTITSDLLRYKITDLKPRTLYEIEMAVENTAGIGNYSEPMEVITEPYISRQVENFHLAKVNVNQTVEIKWDMPCDINGELVSVAGKLYEDRPVHKMVDWKSPIGDHTLPKSYTINYVLKPECFYNITIGIELLNFTGPMNLTSITFTTPAGIPDAYNSSDWGEIAQETSPINNITLTINKSLFSSSKGKILRFTFLISEQYCGEEPKPSQMYFITGNDYVNLPSWYDVIEKQCTKQYQLAKHVNNYNFDEVDSFQFIIGNETCDKETRESSPFCNGPLKLGATYEVMARVFTSNGYADTQPIIFMTEANITTLMVIFIVLSILLTGFFIGIGFMRYKLKHLSIPLTATDIAVKSYNTFYSEMEFDVIVKEYESIDTLDLREYTTIEAKNYKDKNRYANILPYDQNRVLLTPSTYCTSDYINASYIEGYKRKQEYIASQGPKPETCYEFWDMVIETKCHKIVMLTKLAENGITKCFQYYPDLGAELEFNDIKITNMKEDDLTIFTRRELKITKGIAKRLILQYHFQKWPDHDCPENEMDLIKFIQFFKSDNSSVHPIVVHCSAGVGRTGTLIALDMLMQQVQNKKYLNVYETVKKLRYQRVKMVQTFEQYEFLYKSLAKYVQWRWPSTKS